MLLTIQRDAESRDFLYSPKMFQFLQGALPIECRLNPSRLPAPLMAKSQLAFHGEIAGPSLAEKCSFKTTYFKSLTRGRYGSTITHQHCTLGQFSKSGITQHASVARPA